MEGKEKKMVENFMSRVDEIIGAGMLTGIAIYAMRLGSNGGVVEMAITGIIALLVTQAVKNVAK